MGLGTSADAEQLAADDVANLRPNFIIATASITAGTVRVGAARALANTSDVANWNTGRLRSSQVGRVLVELPPRWGWRGLGRFL